MSEISPKNLGSFIKTRRAELRRSLQDVAELAGCSKPHVWDMERGKSKNPTVATLLGLAFALDASPIDLAAMAIMDQPGVCETATGMAPVARTAFGVADQSKQMEP